MRAGGGSDGGMSKEARMVRMWHAVTGVAWGARDASGRWLALVPGESGDACVRAWLRERGCVCREESEGEAFAAQACLDRWFETGESPEVAPAGSEFRLRVWAEVRKIPRGETRTYGELAKAVGCASARAVGVAVGANRVGLFIPCHRVVGAGGAYGGYAWGVPLKRALLEAEGGRR